MKNIKRIIVLGALLLMQFPVGIYACELCKENQPEFLQGVVHGVGPQGPLDYIIMWTAAVIVLVCFVLFAKVLIKPGEKNADHIKNIVVNK